MSFERPDAFIERTDPALESEYAKSLLVLRTDTPRMSTFSTEGIYPEKEVRADYDFVEDKKKKFRDYAGHNPQFAESYKYSVIFEEIMHTEMERSEWLGHEVRTSRATEYDDIVNGIDEIVEFENNTDDNSILGLALDVTFVSDASMTDSVYKKIERIKSEFDAGKLPQIKYGASELTGKMGRITEVPRAIISTDRATVEELVALRKEGPRALADHPIQIRILDELQNQFTVYRTYLLNWATRETNSAKKERLEDMAHIIEDRLSVINRILSTKDELRARLVDEGSLGERRDVGFQTLNAALQENFELEKAA